MRLLPAVFILISTWLVFAARLQGSINDGLVAYYPLDGSSLDASPRKHDLVARDVGYEAGVLGQAARFNGTTSCLLREGILVDAQPFTWSCWFKVDDAPTFDDQAITLINQGLAPGSGQTSPTLHIWGDFSLRYYTWAGEPGVVQSAPGSIVRGRWHFAAVANGTLYLDGVRVGHTTNPFGQVLSHFYIGGSISYGNRNMFKGLIDDVRIYNRELSVDEIASLYSTEALAPGPVIQTAGDMLNGATPLCFLSPADNQIWFTVDGTVPVPGAPGSYLHDRECLLTFDISSYHPAFAQDAPKVIEAGPRLDLEGRLVIQARGYQNGVPRTEVSKRSCRSVAHITPDYPAGLLLAGTGIPDGSVKRVWSDLGAAAKLGSGAAAAGPIAGNPSDEWADYHLDVPGNGWFTAEGELKSRPFLIDEYMGFGNPTYPKRYAIIAELRSGAEGSVSAWGLLVSASTEISPIFLLENFQAIHARVRKSDWASPFAMPPPGSTLELRVIKFHEYDQKLKAALSTSPLTIPATASDLIVVTHGWNNPAELTGWHGGGDSFHGKPTHELEDTDVGKIIENLEAGKLNDELLANALIARYDWSEDAAVGPALDNGLAAGGFRAAEAGYCHGVNLGREILERNGGRAMRIQLIGHSAGTWVCAAAAYYLKQHQPDSQVSIILLDGFFPSETNEARAHAGFPVPPGTVPLRSPLGLLPVPGEFSGKQIVESLADGLGCAVSAYFSRNSISFDPTGSGTEVELWSHSPNRPTADSAGTLVAYQEIRKYWRPTNDDFGPLSDFIRHSGPIAFFNQSIVEKDKFPDGWPSVGLHAGNRVPLRNVIRLGSLPTSLVYGCEPVGLEARASSGRPVDWAVSGPGRIENGFLVVTGAGEISLGASQGGDGNYDVAETVGHAILVAKATAALSVSGAAWTYTGAPQGVQVSVYPAGLRLIATYDESENVPVEAGTYRFAISVDDANYQGTASGLLVIAKAAQTIRLPPVSDFFFGSAPFPYAAFADSTLPVTIDVLEGAVSFPNGKLAATAPGLVTLRARQGGNENWEAAADVIRTFRVKPSFYSWRAPLSRGAPEQDGNDDGTANLVAYAFGLSPTERAGPSDELAPGLPVSRLVDGRMRLEFVADQSRSDVRLDAETSLDLSKWTIAPCEEVSAAGAFRRYRVEIPLGKGPRQFLRLKAVQLFNPEPGL